MRAQALAALVVLLLAPPGRAAVVASAAPSINLAHLDGLALAPAPDAPIATEDLARAALLYGRMAQAAGAPDRAKAALDALLGGQQADGLFPDRLPAAEETALRLTPATGRAGWALAENAARLGKSSPAYAARLRAAALRALGDPAAQGDAASEGLAFAILGLAALVDAAPDPAATAALRAAAETLLAGQQGNGATFPYYAHRPRAEAPAAERGPLVTPRPATVAALTAASVALGRTDLLRAAQREADHFGVHALLAGGPVAGFDPAPRHGPQEPAAVAANVEGLARLWRATRDPRYAQMAGLWAGWLDGANQARLPLYHPATGRVAGGLDGIEAAEPKAGTELPRRVPEPAGRKLAQGGLAATADALLARQALRDVPPAWDWRLAMPASPVAAGPTWLPAQEGALVLPPPSPANREPLGQPGRGIRRLLDRVELAAPVVFRTPVTPGLYLIMPLLAAEGSGELVALAVGPQAWRASLAEPASPAPRLAPPGPAVLLTPRASVRVTAVAPPTAKVRLAGVLLQPAVAARSWRMGGQRLTIARNYTGEARPFTIDGGWKTRIGPHESILVLDRL